MAAHLTDKQKKEIIAEYVECGSYNAVAKKHKITADTVKRCVLKNDKTVKKTIQKKEEENTADILAHMEAKKDVVNQIIDTYLAALLDPEKIKKANPSQLTTALGTIIDKFTMAKVQADESIEDDNLIKALEANAAEVFEAGDDSDMLPEEKE